MAFGDNVEQARDVVWEALTVDENDYASDFEEGNL